MATGTIIEWYLDNVLLKQLSLLNNGKGYYYFEWYKNSTSVSSFGIVKFYVFLSEEGWHLEQYDYGEASSLSDVEVIRDTTNNSFKIYATSVSPHRSDEKKLYTESSIQLLAESFHNAGLTELTLKQMAFYSFNTGPGLLSFLFPRSKYYCKQGTVVAENGRIPAFGKDAPGAPVFVLIVKDFRETYRGMTVLSQPASAQVSAQADKTYDGYNLEYYLYMNPSAMNAKTDTYYGGYSVEIFNNYPSLLQPRVSPYVLTARTFNPLSESLSDNAFPTSNDSSSSLLYNDCTGTYHYVYYTCIDK